MVMSIKLCHDHVKSLHLEKSDAILFDLLFPICQTYRRRGCQCWK